MKDIERDLLRNWFAFRELQQHVKIPKLDASPKVRSLGHDGETGMYNFSVTIECREVIWDSTQVPDHAALLAAFPNHDRIYAFDARRFVNRHIDAFIWADLALLLVGPGFAIVLRDRSGSELTQKIRWWRR